MPEEVARKKSKLTTPRAAAVAGILFSVLFIASVGLMRLIVPDDIRARDSNVWLLTDATTVRLALALLPFAGIAFLWFMGVVRSHLVDREDQFFSTVFYGSGLLFLGMMFVSAALTDGLVSAYALMPTQMAKSEVLAFGREVIYTTTNVYAVRMSGVFMFSLGTVWIRTRAVPRYLSVFTYVLAGVLLLVISQSLWVILVFPLWVLTVSVYYLIVNLRTGEGSQ